MSVECRNSTFEEKEKEKRERAKKSFDYEKIILKSLFVSSQSEADKVFLELVAIQQILKPRDEALTRMQIRDEIGYRIVDEGVDPDVGAFYGCQEAVQYWLRTKRFC